MIDCGANNGDNNDDVDNGHSLLKHLMLNQLNLEWPGGILPIVIMGGPATVRFFLSNEWSWIRGQAPLFDEG